MGVGAGLLTNHKSKNQPIVYEDESVVVLILLILLILI